MACLHDHSCEEHSCSSDWSLYQHIDLPKVKALNESVTGSVKSVFKAWENRLNNSEGFLESNEGDPELLVYIPFTSDVKIKSISIIGGAGGTSPSKMRAFINRDGIDFSDAQNMQPVQEWELAENLQGVLEYQTSKMSSSVASSVQETRGGKDPAWEWGKKIAEIIASNRFWDNMNLALKVFTPLVKVLRRVDGDKVPSMGFLFGDLEVAKMEIKAALGDEKKYIPIWKIIDKRWDDKLNGPLHRAGYFLNPYFYYDKEVIETNGSFMSGFVEVMHKFYPDDNEIIEKIGQQLPMYQLKQGTFGKKFALDGAKKFINLAQWWSFYGTDTPELRAMAMRILNLTTSSSGCERNWSTFEMVEHSVYLSFDTCEELLHMYLRRFYKRYSRFQSVGNLTLHFPENFDGETTQIYYIGLKGEATQLKRDAVAKIVYEVIPNPSDHKTQNDVGGGLSHVE